MKLLRASVWLLCFLQMSLYAQKTGSENMVSLQVDNDVFVPGDEDNYYTSGIFIAYRDVADKFLFWKQEDDDVLLWSASLTHQMFTPVYPSSSYIGNYDRPFAGWLAGAANLAKLDVFSSWGVGLEAGFTGEMSFAKNLQQGFHKFAGITEKPLWIDEIPSEFMMNVKGSYSLALRDYLVLDVLGSMGTKDTYIQPGLVLLIHDYFRNYKYPTEQRHVSGILGIDYRFVGYDALIQGSIWANNAPLTKPVVRSIVWGRVGLRLKLGSFLTEMNYVYGSKQTLTADNHIYGSVKIGFLF